MVHARLSVRHLLITSRVRLIAVLFVDVLSSDCVFYVTMVTRVNFLISWRFGHYNVIKSDCGWKTLISELGFLLRHVETCVYLVVHCYMTVNVYKWCEQPRFEHMGNHTQNSDQLEMIKHIYSGALLLNNIGILEISKYHSTCMLSHQVIGINIVE